MAFDKRWMVGGAVGAVSLVAGCAGTSPEPVAPLAPVALEAQISTDVAALRALHAFEVGDLVMRLPSEATACYGLPCNEADRARWASERNEQALRLHAFVAEASAATPTAAAPTAAEVAQSLEAIASLQIVSVSALADAQPANNPECYNLPCSSDVAAADAENAERHAHLVAIARATAE